MISVVVPVYNEEQNLPELHRRLLQAMRAIGQSFEIIFVNDGSTDKTEIVADTLAPLKLINLQRNYGQTPALDVGIHQSAGDIIVLIDADLQNDPKDIATLLVKFDEGYDVAVGWRKERHDHWTRRVFSAMANRIARVLLGLSLHDFGCGLKVYRSKFIKDFRLWGEAQVFLPAVAKERGARIAEVPIPHYARSAGVANVRISKMIRGVFDLLGIVFFVRWFSRPLRFFGTLGLVSGLLAVAAFGTAIVLRLRHILNFSDTPLPIIGTMFTILSVLLLTFGFLAEMLLRLHYALTQSSPYMVRSVREQ